MSQENDSTVSDTSRAAARPFRRSLAVLALLGLAVSMGDGDQPADDRERALLKTFVDELIDVRPGEGKFPQRLEVGDGNQRRTLAPETPFRMSRYEVPQNLYEEVMGNNPSRWKGRRNSVEMVSWDDARDFCDKLTQKLRAAKRITDDDIVRLPTASEWEYACRAGTTTRYSFGDDPAKLDAHGWHAGNAAGNDPPVGAKAANPWGLYDMHGYLWEWTAEPSDPPDGALRLAHGGAWTAPAAQCASESTQRFHRSSRRPDLGFRCVVAKRVERDRE